MLLIYEQPRTRVKAFFPKTIRADFLKLYSEIQKKLVTLRKRKSPIVAVIEKTLRISSGQKMDFLASGLSGCDFPNVPEKNTDKNLT